MGGACGILLLREAVKRPRLRFGLIALVRVCERNKSLVCVTLYAMSHVHDAALVNAVVVALFVVVVVAATVDPTCISLGRKLAL